MRHDHLCSCTNGLKLQANNFSITNAYALVQVLQTYKKFLEVQYCAII